MLDPAPELRVARRASQGIPKEVAGYIGKENRENKEWNAPHAEISLEDDPEACECGNVPKEDRRDVDNKISQKEVLACEKPYIGDKSTHAY